MSLFRPFNPRKNPPPGEYCLVTQQWREIWNQYVTSPHMVTVPNPGKDFIFKFYFLYFSSEFY
jgi:hypothetical protein